jgi:diadenosine tetraphosphate (Ap4A) HIT family hydrolase
MMHGRVQKPSSAARAAAFSTNPPDSFDRMRCTSVFAIESVANRLHVHFVPRRDGKYGWAAGRDSHSASVVAHKAKATFVHEDE